MITPGTKVKSTKFHIADRVAEDMSFQELVRQKEKVQDEEMEKYLTEELLDSVCDECGNEMMEDVEKNELYCPLGCTSYEL